MFDQQFQELVDKGNPTGEVTSVDEFIINVRGLAPIGVNALVLFDNGGQGLVYEVDGETVVIFSLDTNDVSVGATAVLQEYTLTTGVGEALVGRAVSALGKPLDGGGVPALSENWPVFNGAPDLMNRETLDEQLETGVTLIDTLFPIVLGQRIAVLGDSKIGKSTLLMQIAQNQVNQNRVVVYVMVAKRPDEIEQTMQRLRDSNALQHTIIVATSIFDSLVESYLAPYVGCAIAEHLWLGGRDAIVLYDDFSSHAQIHRELSLMAGANPGRDSYPGDLFYRHSSLLERAGKLKKNNKTLTAIPIVLTPGNDITAYLPTNVISITDGQIILDNDIFREGMRPAINIGLSVSRVGGRAQTAHQKQISGQILQILSDYRDAQEFSHFASEMGMEAQTNLRLGERIMMSLRQTPQELYPLAVQQVLLDCAMHADLSGNLNLGKLKEWLREQNFDIDLPQTDTNAYRDLLDQVIAKHLIKAAK